MPQQHKAPTPNWNSQRRAPALLRMGRRFMPTNRTEASKTEMETHPNKGNFLRNYTGVYSSRGTPPPPHKVSILHEPRDRTRDSL